MVTYRVYAALEKAQAFAANGCVSCQEEQLCLDIMQCHTNTAHSVL